MDKRNDISRDDLDKNGMTPPTFTSDAEEVKTDGIEPVAEPVTKPGITEPEQVEAQAAPAADEGAAVQTKADEPVTKPDDENVAEPVQSEAQNTSNTAESKPPKKPLFDLSDPAKRKRFIIGAVAAVLAVVIIILIVVITRKPPVSVELPGGMSVVQYREAGDIKSTMKKLSKKSEEDEKTKSQITDFVKNIVGDSGLGLMNNNSVESFLSSIVPASLLNSVEGALLSYNDTYKEIDGVEEGDIIRTDGRYLYCVNTSYSADSIAVYTVENGRSEKVTDIEVGSNHTTPEDLIFEYLPDSCYINNFYLLENKLIVMCNDMTVHDGKDEAVTRVVELDIKDVRNPSVVDSFTQSGSLSNSRMIGDMLYVMSYYTPADSNLIPVCGDDETIKELDPECVYSVAKPVEPSYFLISAVNTADPASQPATKAILGGADDVYYGDGCLYIYATDWEYYNKIWDGSLLDMMLSEESDGEEIKGITSSVLKISLNNSIDLAAYSEIDGEIYDKCAFDETDGYLRVVTTSYDNWEEINNLYILDEKLGLVGSVSGFAKNEYINTVRYMGDTAYVVTYNETAPLNVIDLSDPKAPKSKGAVEVKGFSDMLVPADDNKVLSIGYCDEKGDHCDWYNAAGMKLTLFDVSDRFNPKALDTKSYVKYYSEVQGNPNALVYNPDRDEYLIPLNYDESFVSSSDKEAKAESATAEGGMLCFKLVDGKIVESDKQKAECSYIERCEYLEDYVYMFGYDLEGIHIESAKYKQ